MDPGRLATVVYAVPVAEEPQGARLGDMSDVHQCPFCELKFLNLKELQFHIQLDHPDRKVPERRF